MNPEELGNSNGKSIDAHLTKWREFVSSGSISTSSILVKSHSESKSKRRKTEMIQVHGGRSIRSSGRKDKHSKVCTMRGPKDRRLRLSPKTAIEFYDVQDRLGYDRASKAIDWLMKAAKSAIDALDEPPPMHCVTENHSPPIVKTQEIHQGPDNSIPGFSIFTDYTATSSSTEFRPNPDNDLSYQEGFLSALANTPQQIFDTNLEIARMQRSFAFANSNLGNSRGGRTGDYDSFMNSVPPDFPGPSPGLGYSQMFTQREPLQSSINHFSPIGNQFPGIHFSREDFSSLNGAATLKEEENDNINPFSTASFLHYQD